MKLNEIKLGSVKFYAKSILETLKYLHSRGIAHRHLESGKMIVEHGSKNLKIGSVCSKMIKDDIRKYVLAIDLGLAIKPTSSLDLENCDFDID